MTAINTRGDTLGMNITLKITYLPYHRMRLLMISWEFIEKEIEYILVDIVSLQRRSVIVDRNPWFGKEELVRVTACGDTRYTLEYLS